MDTNSDGSHALQSTRAPESPGPRRRQATRRGGGQRRMPKERAALPPHLTPTRFWEFAALAHEIKQPLTAILSNGQAAWHFLAMDTPNLPEARAALADIITGARRTNEVIRQLQAFLTAGTLEQTCLNINDVIHETIGLVRSDAEAQHVRITLDLTGDLSPVAGDRIQLRQVLLNLVRNAFEAMQQVEDERRTLVVRTTLTTPGGITVAVQDSGLSIDETSLARLFHPFFTTKTGGMGLGLALSRSIITAHGGWIWATPHPERGLTMSFTLPAV
jgi:two-component system, LuxR family, sensor kinase FixL